jgi:hypothetical protein
MKDYRLLAKNQKHKERLYSYQEGTAFLFSHILKMALLYNIVDNSFKNKRNLNVQMLSLLTPRKVSKTFCLANKNQGVLDTFQGVLDNFETVLDKNQGVLDTFQRVLDIF